MCYAQPLRYSDRCVTPRNAHVTMAMYIVAVRLSCMAGSQWVPWRRWSMFEYHKYVILIMAYCPSWTLRIALMSLLTAVVTVTVSPSVCVPIIDSNAAQYDSGWPSKDTA